MYLKRVVANVLKNLKFLYWITGLQLKWDLAVLDRDTPIFRSTVSPLISVPPHLNERL